MAGKSRAHEVAGAIGVGDEPSTVVGARVSAKTLARIDNIIAQRREAEPGLRLVRSDVIRIALNHGLPVIESAGGS